MILPISASQIAFSTWIVLWLFIWDFHKIQRACLIERYIPGWPYLPSNSATYIATWTWWSVLSFIRNESLLGNPTNELA
jgi:hypothetical protein